MPGRLDQRCWLAGLIVIVVLGAALPAHAGYDKLWRFWKPAHISETANPRIRAFTNAMEVVVDQYSGWRNPWVAQDNVDYVLKGGVYSTRILYNNLISPLPANPSTGEQWSWDKAAKIGWSTSDGSCRLNDLTWVYDGPNGNVLEPIIDVEDVGSQVPGGGYVIGADGYYTWYVTNDTDYDLILLNVEFTWVQQPPWELDIGYLSTAAEEGGIGLLIRVLGDSVIDAWIKGDLPDPSENSLLGKLESASDDYLAGLAAAQAGNLAEAEQDWAAAIKHMETFIKEIKTSMKAGKLRVDLAALWIADAQEIIYRLDLLPQVKPPDNIPGGYATIAPGQEIGIPIVGAQDGDAVLLHGVLVDSNGDAVLDWVDKADIKAEMVPPTVTCEISSLVAPVNVDGVDVYLTPPTVTLTSADPDLASIQVIEHPYYDPDDPTEHLMPAPTPVGSGWSTTFGEDGVYVIAFWGVDTTGNTSEIESVTVHVQLDKTPPVITGVFDIRPDALWPPDHYMYEVFLPDANTIVDDQLPVKWHIVAIESNQPVDGTGDGDYAPDWEVIVDEDGAEHVWLRSERSGNHPTEVRVYAIYAVAEDLAGNRSGLTKAEAVSDTVSIDHDVGT